MEGPDDGQELHDHPRSFVSFVLRGEYREQVARFSYRRVRWLNVKRRGEYHRINDLAPGGALTLVFFGPERGSWGFLVNGEHVDWKVHTAGTPRKA